MKKGTIKANKIIIIPQAVNKQKNQSNKVS